MTNDPVLNDALCVWSHVSKDPQFMHSTGGGLACQRVCLGHCIEAKYKMPHLKEIAAVTPTDWQHSTRMLL